MNRRVIVLGSTGSIGRNTLDVLKNLRDEWTVVGLAAGSRGSDLAAQANAFRYCSCRFGMMRITPLAH